ncbi:MAG: MCE family protein [Nitrospirae bacterium]|nr:MCE family protein [Nitrospirota bacterium]
MQTEAKVGIAVIMGAALLVLLLGKVERWTRADQVGTTLVARFDTVAGLELKSPVQVAGVKVGEVSAIRLRDNQAEVVIALYPDVAIYRGAQAAIKSTGLLGEKYLELLPGKPEQGSYAEGEVIPQQPGSGDIDRLVSQLNAVAEDIRAVASALRETVASDAGRTRLEAILDNTRDFARTLNDKGPRIMERIDAILARIDRGEGTLGKLVNDPNAYDDLQAALEDVRGMVAQVNKGEGTLGKLVNDPALYDRLEGAAGGVEQIAKKIASGEGTLGRLLTDDATVESFNSAMDSVGAMGDRLTRLRTFITFRNEFQTRTADNKGYFTLRIDPGSKRSYVVEVVSDPAGRANLVQREITSGGATTFSEEVTTSRKLLFTGLFDQRFGDWGVRGGLMESTFGMGLDYAGLDRVNLLLDAWDFNSVRPRQDLARLKATVRYRVNDYVFVQTGMDNFLNTDIDSAFLGAGLTFEDEDIKYLLGGAVSSLN